MVFHLSNFSGNRGYDREDKKNSIFDPEPIASFREENFKTNKSGKVDEKLKISKSSKFRLTLNRVNRYCLSFEIIILGVQQQSFRLSNQISINKQKVNFINFYKTIVC